MPDGEVFNMAIICLIKGGVSCQVLVLLEQFVTCGLKPAFNTYLTLLQALYGAGETGQADKYLKMMTEQGLVSNIFSYNMIIDFGVRPDASNAFQFWS
ncbi:hypothetical protein MLD38_023591 [Melastoma candidum]|uniref:Uncharacterized protein n=1 Tax=Melastoma candidum TaxID=119954 RepID=A0ACB9NT22_9MYRT|nr:hypothetical protein MLD38_023591 [Melastoma candidum]